MRRVWVLLAALVLCCAAAPAQITTVQQLVTFVKSSVQLHQNDLEVANYLKTVKLKERLDERTLEQLQGGGGIGPKTLAALRDLTLKTAGLAEAAPPPAAVKPSAPIGPPPPDSIEQARMLAAIRENAISYTNSLPNYICGRVTRRHIDPSGTEFWREVDKVHEQLTFFDHEEKLKVVSVNGQLKNNVERTQLGGATSSGEFGSLLAEIFSPETDTEFHWERWATLRGKRMAVFGFRVRQSRSKYSIYHQPSQRKIIAGYSGLVYADRGSHQVMRLALHCEDMPVDYPIQEVSVTLDYEPTQIGDQSFVLPLKSDLHSREGRFLIWNETEFVLYRKFGADTSITFDTVDSVPEEKLKETPAKPDDAKNDKQKKKNDR